MIKRSYLLPILLSFVLLSACDKTINNEVTPPPPPPPPPPVVLNPQPPLGAGDELPPPAGNPTPPPPAPSGTSFESVTVSPAPIAVGLCKSKVFSAVSKTGEPATYNWFVNNLKGGAVETGIITDQAVYTAPRTLPTNPTITVKAQNSADVLKIGTSSVTLQSMTVTNPRLINDPKAAGALGMRPVDSESENATPKQIAIAGNKLCSVWSDTHSGDNDIYAACSPDLSGLFGSAVKVNTVTQGSQETPTLVGGSDGVLYVAWCGPETADKKLHFAKSTNGTSFATTEVSVNQNKGFNMDPLCAHSIAVGPDNFIYVVAIGTETNTGGNGNVGLFCSEDNGRTFMLVTAKLNRAQNDGNNSDAADYPAIAVDSNKNVHIVWDDERDGQRHVYYDKGTRSGTNHCNKLTFTNSDIRVSNRPNEKTTDQDYTASLFWANNTVHVAWVGADDLSTIPRIFYAKKTDAGTSFTKGVAVDSNPPNQNFDQLRPAIAVTPRGLIYASWTDSRHAVDKGLPVGGPFAAKSCDNGATFTPAMSVNIAANGLSSPNGVDDVAITTDSSGQIYMSWHDEPSDKLQVTTVDGASN